MVMADERKLKPFVVFESVCLIAELTQCPGVVVMMSRNGWMKDRRLDCGILGEGVGSLNLCTQTSNLGCLQVCEQHKKNYTITMQYS